MSSLKTRNYPQWFIDELVNNEDKERALCGSLISTEVVSFRCSNGHIYSQLVNSHIRIDNGTRKQGCPLCRKMCKYDFPEWFIDELLYDVDKQKARKRELNADSKVFFKCKNGCVYSRIIHQHIKLSTGEKKQDCPFCKNKHISDTLKENSKNKSRVYPMWFIEELVNDEDKDRAKQGSLSVTDKVDFKCSSGHVYTQLVSNHIVLSTGSRKQGCPICSALVSLDKRKKTFSLKRSYPSWFIDELYLDEDKDKARCGLLTTNDFVTFICDKGHIYKQRVYNHIDTQNKSRKQRCPVCTHNRSLDELEIETFINSLGYSTEHCRGIIPNEIEPNNKRKNLELDIFVKEKNIGIEYNGSYYHKTLPIDKYSKSKKYHYHKYISCRNKGILLVTIFDVEWNTKKESIKDYLQDLFCGRENSLSFFNGYMNNNYPSPKYFKDSFSHIEHSYTKDSFLVYTCGFSFINKIES